MILLTDQCLVLIRGVLNERRFVVFEPSAVAINAAAAAAAAAAVFLFSVHEMCRTVRCTPPRAEILRSAFINAGYRVSGSHANPLALKTDAPPKVVWDIIRSWIKQHPVKEPDPGSYAAAILSKPIETEGDFRKAAGAVPNSVKQGVTRFVQNPAYWGPKARHGRPLKPEQQRQQEVQAAQRRARQQQGNGGSEAAAAGGAGSSAQQEQQEDIELDDLYEDEGTHAAAAAAAAAGDEAGVYDVVTRESPPHKKTKQSQPAATAAVPS
jgi:tRNA (guanine26-N2/guanine27-N2)-dimethyltransferase